jgi:predicted negative regulator of RcsB-dependent stress response
MQDAAHISLRWLVTALACAVIVGGSAWCAVWWQKRAFAMDPLRQGQSAYKQQDWQRAERYARQRLKQNHNDSQALRLLGRSLYRQGRDEAASAIFRRVGAETMAAEDCLLVGQAYVRSGDIDPAITAWQKAVQLDPEHVESRIALEQVFFRLNRLVDAEREAATLLAQPGRDALAECLRGEIRARQSDPAGAAKSFERALEQPEQWKSLVEPDLIRKQLIRCLLRTGQPALAREQVRLLAARDPDQETCWFLSRCDLQEAISTEPAVAAQARSYRKSHSMEPEPAPFVGEARCAGCHPQNFHDQHASRHARTFSRKQELSSIPLSERPITDPGNERVSHAIRKRGEGLEVETRSARQIYRTVVDYAFGSGSRGLTMVGHDTSGRALECRLSLYPGRLGWDVTTGQTFEPGQETELYQGHFVSSDEVRQCITCHSTDPYAILNAASTRSSDRAIGCERCHGPGGNHVKAAASKNLASDQDADFGIARPSLASGPAIVALCAECHSPPKAGAVLTPGSPSSIRFQGRTLTWSRCYTESGDRLDCVTCHNPHRNAETSTRWYESRCLQCHSAASTTTGRAATPASALDAGGRTPCPIQPDSGCVACHMPKLPSTMSHTLFTDHFIRVHPASETNRGAHDTD